MSIAICKLLGTVCASLAFYLYSSLSHASVLLPFLYVAIFIYDLIYVGMLYKQHQMTKKKLPESNAEFQPVEIKT